MHGSSVHKGVGDDDGGIKVGGWSEVEVHAQHEGPSSRALTLANVECSLQYLLSSALSQQPPVDALESTFLGTP